MGVLYDYFRAHDRDAAVKVVELPAGPLVAGDPRQPSFDGVDAKGVDPAVCLGKLVAIARGVPWSVDVVRSAGIWPPPETAPSSADEEIPEDSPWASGPWVEEIDDRTRDTLADIGDDRRGEIAVQWAQIEEFSQYSDVHDDSLSPLVAELSGLAGRAREAGDHLYCWSCL